jgi:hypothetical protein
MSDQPPTESPTEDWVAQRESVQPDLDDDDDAIADELEANEADLAEQARVVPVDDDYDR